MAVKAKGCHGQRLPWLRVAQEKAERIIAEELKRMGWEESDLERKGVS